MGPGHRKGMSVNKEEAHRWRPICLFFGGRGTPLDTTPCFPGPPKHQVIAILQVCTQRRHRTFGTLPACGFHALELRKSVLRRRDCELWQTVDHLVPQSGLGDFSATPGGRGRGLLEPTKRQSRFECPYTNKPTQKKNENTHLRTCRGKVMTPSFARMRPAKDTCCRNIFSVISPAAPLAIGSFSGAGGSVCGSAPCSPGCSPAALDEEDFCKRCSTSRVSFDAISDVAISTWYTRPRTGSSRLAASASILFVSNPRFAHTESGSHSDVFASVRSWACLKMMASVSVRNFFNASGPC